MSLIWEKETLQPENKYRDNQSNGIMTEAETKTLKTETKNMKVTAMESTIGKDPINLQDAITTEKFNICYLMIFLCYSTFSYHFFRIDQEMRKKI